jgi:hypothetical protein
MDCEEFLNGYSDFRDGLLPFEAAVEFEIHLDACGSCGRYDRVVRHGAELCRDLPEVELSGDFRARLQDRLLDVEEEMRGPARSASGLPASAALSIAAAVALAAWLPAVREGGSPAHLPAVAARAPQPTGELLVAGALLAHRALLHREAHPAAGDDHLLFGYFPVAAPAAVRIAAAD